jgi:hypothetical protein
MWRGEGDEEKRAKELLRIPSGSLIMDPVGFGGARSDFRGFA